MRAGVGPVVRADERSDGERVRDDLLGLLVDAVEDYAILMLAVDGRVVTWNAGAQRVKGYRPEEIIGRHFSVFYPQADIDARKPDRELAIAVAVGRLEDEGWRVRQNGEWFWASVVITALRDTDGSLRGFGKITRDLTERRANESALRVSEERFRRSFDQALIGMMIIDLQGRYERVNDAFCAIVGYSHEQLTGLSRERITHPDDTANDAAALRTLLAGAATSYTTEKRYLHAVGHAVRAQVNVTLISDTDGRPLHFIAQAQDITERHLRDQQLQHMADHDPLTGLLNRRSFRHELEGHIARVARYGATGAVLMLDLDHFKYVNDTQSHSAGDELIVRIAQGLRSRLRDSDVLARLGGDEFAVLLPAADLGETQLVADALLQLLREEAMPTPIAGGGRVTASIGIARFDDGERLSAEEMMVNADLAMYDAKEAGRDRCVRYRTAKHAHPRSESRMKWAEQIQDAIAHDTFELLAQPIVAFTRNGPAQYELLLRMRDSQGDLIAPGSFLYIAERLGLIADIDRWVTERAIQILAEQRALGNDLRLEVNLCGRTIGEEELLELIKRCLDETGVPPDRLIFEITETAAVTHIARAARFAERLSELGCKFALDDFGAGLGSFYYLKHLPFDYLKIDGEFVRHCASNDTDRTLISAIVGIARGMGTQTIAEFVGDEETAEVLARLGVDYGQGFHLGRPAPLTEHLARQHTPATAPQATPPHSTRRHTSPPGL
ncbi:MAG: EAL domain-containing protein [Actinomycetota bacterium]|nr:EAL domain-containing protein [Actinomycetota bacterium]